VATVGPEQLMSANFIDFVNSLVYSDVGTAELGPPPAGTKNHMIWSLDNLPSSSSTTVSGTEFLNHHLDVMLGRYQAWRSKYFLPPLRPWNGSDCFPHPSSVSEAPISPPLPAALSGGAFPAGWTTDNLGNAVRLYYNSLRHFTVPAPDGREIELQDEIKAPFSYRYWAFVKWADDLRRRLLGQPVLPVGVVYDRDGTILSEKEFTDYFNQVHHVWHPDSPPPPSWTTPTPGFKTAVGQFRRKQQLGRAQIGLEFFAFHRDHLMLFDRWLARTGQDAIQSQNVCGHDANEPPSPPPPAGLDVFEFYGGPGVGYPYMHWANRTANFHPNHANVWDGTRAGFDGTLREFSSPGEMGAFMATDFDGGFGAIPTPPAIAGTSAAADTGYHGEGHVLNGDIVIPEANNYVPRFFSWHGFLDSAWERRQPQFTALEPVVPAGAGGAAITPAVLTLVREPGAATDALDPAGALAGLQLDTGQGTLRYRINVRNDPFNRPLELTLRLDVVRPAGGVESVPISLTRNLVVLPVGTAPAAANERPQAADFFEDFVFDGSPGTLDPAGNGPFLSDSPALPPAGPVGFVNSAVRLTATLRCTQLPDGSTPPHPGSIASVGVNITGSGTNFSTLLRRGDLIRAGGQVRQVNTIAAGPAGATSLTTTTAFSPVLAPGTAYEKLDGFDHEQAAELTLVQEKDAPAVTTYLDRSTFSKDQVDAIAAGGQSVFDNAFYVIVQDRTSRAVPITWPPDLLPELYGLIAAPLSAAGLFAGLAHPPALELRDVATDAAIANLTVTVTGADAEDPTLHPSVPQRVTYRCSVTFTGNAMFAGLPPGGSQDLKLVITVRDRAGNTLVDESARVRLQLDPNPYMLDGPTSWLSVDTRVFKVNQGQARFGVPAGWSDPNTFIAQVIDNLRAGNGSAGGESFDGLTQDQAGSVLEYSTQVGGVNLFNFALAKVRLQSAAGAADVRASFRLFRWGVANVSFDDTLAYRRDGASGVALLGRTTSDELASVPFFAAGRVPLTQPLTAQTDPKNLFTFGPTGGGEATSFYGAYLDINQSTPRFPQTYLPANPNGPFNTLPAGSLRSVRDLLIGNHQCMVVELAYAPDPTVPGSNPGNSDNLAQRNLLIVQTANPGTVATRTVQHSFDIDLTRRHPRGRRLARLEAALTARARAAGEEGDATHEHADMTTTPNDHDVMHKEMGEHEHEPVDEHDDDEAAVEISELPQPVRPPMPAPESGHHAHDHTEHILGGWLRLVPEVVEARRARMHAARDEEERWQIDIDQWKPAEGVDELVFFWNNLPRQAIVDLYLPAASVTETVNYRNLRHAPSTVKIVNAQTLRLRVGGPTYLPVPPFWGDHLAGLITVTLPAGIKKGQQFTVDVLQMRSDTRRVLGGFQLKIQIEPAADLIAPERRLVELFKRRLALTPKRDRWRPIIERELALARQRGRAFADEAGDPRSWDDAIGTERGQPVRVVLEQIQILDDHDPFLKGAGEFRFRGRVYTHDNGGQRQETRLPAQGEYKISDKPHKNTVHVDLPLFEGFVEKHLAVELLGIEQDTFDPDDKLPPYRRVFTGPPDGWLGAFGPGDEEIEPEDLGDWRVWYRVERS
jgi:hypothetical protein